MLDNNPPLVEVDLVVAQIDESFTRQFDQYFGQLGQTPITGLDQAREILRDIEKETGIKPALIYATFFPANLAPPSTSQADGSTLPPGNPLPQPDDELELVLITSQEKPVRVRVPGATRAKVLLIAEEFSLATADVIRRRRYLPPSQQLYQWLVAPLQAALQAQEINNLTFLMDAGLRSIPIAALHDGTGFIVESYSVGLMPSLSLTDTRYKDIRNVQVLAMGADEFSDQDPLPAVPVEISAIAGQLWPGKSFLNNSFTLTNLERVRATEPFGIVHLATHAIFRAGDPSQSYIQLWDRRLGLDQLRELSLNNPPVELFVLSACDTALGDPEAELGFAGLASQAGVKSALGSLWSVSDEGTLALMTSFYEQLKTAPIKAEALRQAQLAMLRSEVRLEDGQLVTRERRFPLPDALAESGNRELSHPYYWSAFTMIGNPW